MYILKLKTTIENKIRTKGFNFSDFKLTLDYNAVTSLLMGENIYGNKKYGLREIIQNSIDACKIMQEESKQHQEYKYTNYTPFIRIVLDKDRKQVSILDNGKGMSIDILKKYFLNVGVSYYVSNDYIFSGNNYKPIGNYGIGFLSCFMLSDSVIVNTKFYGESKLNKIDFERNSEYICLTYEEDSRLHGTEIILNYDQFMGVFSNRVEFIKLFIEENFLDCNMPIKLLYLENNNLSEYVCSLRSIDSIYPGAIVLDKYLNNISARVNCSYKNITFVNCLSDISGNTSYYYDGSSNHLDQESDDSDSYKLINFVDDGELKYIDIAVIGNSQYKNFMKAFDVLEDYDEALQKIGDYDSVSIITEDFSLYTYDEIIEDSWMSVVGNYHFNDFCSDQFHNSETPIFPKLITEKVITNDSDVILVYQNDLPFGGSHIFEHEDKTYIKNVLISNVRLYIPFLIGGVYIKGAVININSKYIKPTVSRNNVTDYDKREIEYAIGKALHLWIVENAALSSNELNLVRKFIDLKYLKSSNLIRDGLNE